MEPKMFMVNITSENPERLMAFYRDVVKLPRLEGMGDAAFDIGGTPFTIDGHSEIKGQAKEPARCLLSMRVDDVAGERERLEAQGVEFIRKEGTEFWGGTISTFLDPDGNYMQLMSWPDE